MAERVEIVEVGPRDGLQNETAFVPVAAKVRLIDMLSACGLKRIEAASFVSAKWVPQMAGSAEVLAGIARAPGVRYTALTPNLRGYRDAVEAGADEVAVFAAASESFSKANINCSIAESIDRFAPVFEAAKAGGVPVRGYVSCVTDCPFEGAVAPAAVARVVAALAGAGAHEVSLGETLGRGTRDAVAAMLEAVLDVLPADRLAGHFHDTGGRALENIAVAFDKGLRVFDAAVGGLGGCPYAPGAAGNVATEAVLAWCEGRGIETGLDAGCVARAGRYARGLKGGGGADDQD